MEIKTFKFNDGKEVVLKEPTILQLEASQKRHGKDELGVAKALLVEMSEGELTIEGINSLSVREFKRLLESIKDFVGIEISD